MEQIISGGLTELGYPFLQKHTKNSRDSSSGVNHRGLARKLLKLFFLIVFKGYCWDCAWKCELDHV